MIEFQAQNEPKEIKLKQGNCHIDVAKHVLYDFIPKIQEHESYGNDATNAVILVLLGNCHIIAQENTEREHRTEYNGTIWHIYISPIYYKGVIIPYKFLIKHQSIQDFFIEIWHFVRITLILSFNLVIGILIVRQSDETESEESGDLF